MAKAVVDHGPFAGLLNNDLRGRKSSREEKLWLGTQQTNKALNFASAAELAKRYNLKEDTVRRYALRLAKHRTVAAGPGRSRGFKDRVPRKNDTRQKTSCARFGYFPRSPRESTW